MLKGFITLTNHHKGLANPRVAALNVASFARNVKGGYTEVTLFSRSLDGEHAVNDTYHVQETEEEIEALLEEAQADTPRRSEFAQAMGHAIGAFGGGR